VAGFISEWWPTSNRNGGRLQIGIGGRIASEFADCGFRRTERWRYFDPSDGQWTAVQVQRAMKQTGTADRRSERIARIRAKDTGQEMIVRRLVHGMGVQLPNSWGAYRLQWTV
jgi:hypothetical protein